MASGLVCTLHSPQPLPRQPTVHIRQWCSAKGQAQCLQMSCQCRPAGSCQHSGLFGAGACNDPFDATAKVPWLDSTWLLCGVLSASHIPSFFRLHFSHTARLIFLHRNHGDTYEGEARCQGASKGMYHPLAPVCRIHEADFLPHCRSKGPVYRPASTSWMATA